MGIIFTEDTIEKYEQFRQICLKKFQYVNSTGTRRTRDSVHVNCLIIFLIIQSLLMLML